MPKPPPIDTALIEHLGELARIRLPAERQTELSSKLQQLVNAFSSLAEADFASSAPATSITATTPSLTPLQLRVDQAETPPSTTEVLANAPQTAADCFVVARVVEP